MKLLNLGCGDTRPGEPWTNVDVFHSMFAVGTPERAQIDALPNYVEANLLDKLPFEDATYDGCLCSHILEHFNAQDGLRLLLEAKRVLKPDGIVLVSVPDASYFRKVYWEDRNENWPRLFETTDPNNPIPTFFEAALWFNEHAAILTEDAVWCYLKRAGFSVCPKEWPVADLNEVSEAMAKQLNRRSFSVEMIGIKE